jgi:DNA-binding NarL/FixJ family response regulator
VPLEIFLVDDSAPVRERLLAMLAAIAGVFVVGQAENAALAIRDILELRPQVVLLDLKLGDGGSGFDVLRAVRPQAPEIDFYLLSNFSTPAYRRSAEDLGARGFYDKTQEFGRLMDVIAERARRAP